MKNRRVRKAFILVNSFGMVGYVCTLVAWTLFVAVILLIVMQSSVVTLPSEPTIQSGGTGVATESPFAAKVFAYLITTVIVVLSVAIFVTLPYFIAKVGSRFLRRGLKMLHITPAKRNVFFAKCVVIIIPLLGFIGITLGNDPVDMTIPAVHIATILAGLLAIGSFLLQIVIARSLDVPSRDVW